MIRRCNKCTGRSLTQGHWQSKSLTYIFSIHFWLALLFMSCFHQSAGVYWCSIIRTSPSLRRKTQKDKETVRLSFLFRNLGANMLWPENVAIFYVWWGCIDSQNFSLVNTLPTGYGCNIELFVGICPIFSIIQFVAQLKLWTSEWSTLVSPKSWQNSMIVHRISVVVEVLISGMFLMVFS